MRRTAILATLAVLAGCAGSSPRPTPSAAPDEVQASWPSFRGPAASGVADGQALPETWSGETGDNIRWKTALPGLAHSSPVIWGERIFITSAVSTGDPDASFRHGLYGDGDAADDRSVHRFVVLALDRRTGEVVWERTATEGVPLDKRHIKATYANSTPATDGRHVIAWFGSQGLFGYDVEGNPLWSRDLGRLDSGAYNAPEYEWGMASSPILDGDRVFVQADTQGESFLLALDAGNGETLWRTKRDELPSWGTPTVYPGPPRRELVTNGSNFIRGYDPSTGKELWRLGGSSKITAPTPIYQDGLIVVASGRRPEAPIFVIRAGGTGDLTLPESDDSSDGIVWSRQKRGSYMPTPLIYDGLLFVIANQGILDCYDLETGEERFRERIPHSGGGFSASPVAADGKLYLSGEDGDVFVVRAAPRFELIATNPMGERLMATPALADGTLYVRGERHLFAVGSDD